MIFSYFMRFVQLHKKGDDFLLNIEKIRALVKEHGISITFLCSKIGVNNHYFLDVSKKNIPVPDERVLLIADILDTTVEYLTDQTDNPARIKEIPVYGNVAATLYARLENLCKAKGVNITTMCKESGVNRGTLTDLKMGRRKFLSYESLIKLSEYFDVSVEYIAGKSDEKEKAPSAISDEDVKIALFGGDTDVTDEMWNEVMSYAEYLKQKYGKT